MRAKSKRAENEKKMKHILQFEQIYFLYCVFLAGPLALHLKDDL